MKTSQIAEAAMRKGGLSPKIMKIPTGQGIKACMVRKQEKTPKDA